jgi:hypothetical protein
MQNMQTDTVGLQANSVDYAIKATYRKTHSGSTAIAVHFLPPRPFIGPPRVPTVYYKPGQLYPAPGHAVMIRHWIAQRLPFRITTASVADGLALFGMLADGLKALQDTGSAS